MNNDSNQLWFIYDYYAAAGRPKAEDAVMKYAQEQYLHCLAPEYMLEEIQRDLEIYCMKLREQNKRLAPVDISFTKNHCNEGHVWLKIGAQSLHLRRVKKTIE